MTEVYLVMCEQHYAHNVSPIAIFDEEHSDEAEELAEKNSDYHVYNVTLNDPQGAMG
jgi:hypothetical protein